MIDNGLIGRNPSRNNHATDRCLRHSPDQTEEPAAACATSASSSSASAASPSPNLPSPDKAAGKKAAKDATAEEIRNRCGRGKKYSRIAERLAEAADEDEEEEDDDDM